MFLNGERREARSRIDVLDPFTDQMVGSVSADSEQDISEAIASVRSYDFSLSAESRSILLNRAAEILQIRAAAFAELITAESGNCMKDSRKEVGRAISNLHVAACEAQRLHGESLFVDVADRQATAMTMYEPVGVVCAITPYNRPLNQVVVKMAAALAANNAVVVKPSEKTPLTALAFAEILVEAGFPVNMLSLVTGHPQEIGPYLAAHRDVDMVSFTGSVEVGEQLSRQVGMKKLALELGGNDPLIVLDDAPLDLAARIAVTGALATAGQSCRGVKRIIVLDAIADEFIRCLRSRVEETKYGDPKDPQTDVGTLINERAAAVVEQRCNKAVSEGAKLIVGGKRQRALFSPTVIDYVPPDTELVAQETFGPVAPVIRVATIDDAISVANSTVYGLQAGVMTHSYSHFMKIAKQLRVGGVALLNGPQFESPHIPFGGVKKSGIGREGIRYAMREMCTVKTILLPMVMD